MAKCDFMIGNSSAGIIEAASFNTPVINLGSRQNLRERSLNVVDVPLERAPILDAIAAVLKAGRQTVVNVYGDGAAAQRIASLLRVLPVDSALLAKINAY